MDRELIQKMIDLAIEQLQYSYTPYSHFKVGAALTKDGKLYTGCNIENAAYTPTNCAERTAFLRPSARVSGNFGRSALWEERTAS